MAKRRKSREGSDTNGLGEVILFIAFVLYWQWTQGNLPHPSLMVAVLFLVILVFGGVLVLIKLIGLMARRERGEKQDAQIIFVLLILFTIPWIYWQWISGMLPQTWRIAATVLLFIFALMVVLALVQRTGHIARREGKTRQDTQGFVGVILFIALWFYWQWTSGKLPHSWLIATAVFLVSLVIAGVPALIQLRRYTLIRRDLSDITPRQFEERVEMLLQDSGWTKVKRVGGSGDRGIDLWGTCGDKRYIVQCKHKASVTASDMRDFVGALTNHPGADRGLFITSGRFTNPARLEARGNPLNLCDGDELVRRIHQAKAAQQSHQAKQRTRLRGITFYGSIVIINMLVIGWALITTLP